MISVKFQVFKNLSLVERFLLSYMLAKQTNYSSHPAQHIFLVRIECLKWELYVAIFGFMIIKLINFYLKLIFSSHFILKMSSEKIDESLYSRQLYVIGVEAMKKLISSSVMISGIGGLELKLRKILFLLELKMLFFMILDLQK
jgi:hypothetical protein